ncbi:DUF4097 family beta strand repeat-containing protein [Saccharopolyspora hordei]|uniref:DUF4097 domain-containing protein n=1 Tax=Saccharopolyspora hordei TaxID=1838 RepID=A0A853ACL1_9PSEU|nr:DUF4097 family beta strand repeat-containing protein [Saccharopolyspora hordei]NYI82192.1 hypothetical protein [Saccharopolyspora hordei]
MARLGLAIGGVALVLLGGAVAAWGALDRDEERTDPVAGIGRVVLDGGSGSVEVRYAPGGRGQVTQHVQRWGLAAWGDGDEAGHRVEGDTLVLDAGCGWNCSVSYQVTLPTPVPVEGELDSGSLSAVGMRSVRAEFRSGSVDAREVSGPVDVRTGSGSVHLAGVDGPVTVRTRSGSIDLADVAGRVEAKAGSGGISGADLRGAEVVVETGSGQIELQLTGPRSAEVTTGSGGIDLTVPADRYRVETDTGSGGVDVDVVQDPAAEKRLVLSTGSGDVRVRS